MHEQIQTLVNGYNSGFALSPRSLERLGGVHKGLAAIVRRAILLSAVDFTVLEGRRTSARQKLLVEQGASNTMNSRHLSGHAVDLGAWIGGAVRWDWPLYEKINHAMQLAAAEAGVHVEWGGDWKSFRDGPHFQLPWADYPLLRQAQDEEVWGVEAQDEVWGEEVQDEDVRNGEAQDLENQNDRVV